MATTLYLRQAASPLNVAGWKQLSQRRGGIAITTVTTTTSGGTNIHVTETAGGQTIDWISGPLTQGVTISGSITVNLRCRESATSVNAGVGVQMTRLDNAGVAISTFVGSQTVGAEAGTTESARSATITPTSTTFDAGDRIRIRLTARNVGTMNAGTFNTFHNGRDAGASGDSYATFTEDFCTDDELDVPAFEIYGSNGYKG